jgi:small subunit ribosomal protein S7
MRRPIKQKHTLEADTQYNSLRVARFTNVIMWDGKKTVAAKIVADAFEIIKEKTQNPNPLEVFDMAIKNAQPTVEVRSRRVGGANYQVPREIRAERRQQLAIRWIIAEARKKSGKPMANCIADELIAASKNEGAAIQKRDNTHKMAEANKAFAHMSW